MRVSVAAPSYKRHRFPPAIIGHAVWLYFRFGRSYRDVEELLAERGVIVTYETVRQVRPGLRERAAPPSVAAWR
jgi:putative transposase